LGHDPLKSASKIYPSQTKILEGLTRDEIQIFDIPFKGVSTRFGRRTIEKYIENLDFIFCSSFQNLRLGGIKSAFRLLFLIPKSSFGEHKLYPSQTKILEGGTKGYIWIVEALFKGVSTRFGIRTIEKSIENPDVIFCSAFQNLRLGSIKLHVFLARYCDAM
jgi:hypothetical protein